jgi:hypothetical protein
MRPMSFAAALAVGVWFAGMTGASAGEFYGGPAEDYFAPAPPLPGYAAPEVIVKERTYIVRRPTIVRPPVHVYVPRRPHVAGYFAPEPVYEEPYPRHFVPEPVYEEPYSRRVTKSVTVEEGPEW